MGAPTAADLVRVWELGRDRPVWYQGLLMLAPLYPDLSFRDMAKASIGRRNIALFKLRHRLFGPHLTALAACPRCATPSEFTAGIAELCPHDLPDAPMAEAPEFTVTAHGVALRCRPLTSEDLAACHPQGGVAHHALLHRAVIEARHEDQTVMPGQWPSGLHADLIDALHHHDPQLELELSVDCTECGHEWVTLFDPAAFLWREVANFAERLLHDVHLLARNYGWREADILAMSSARRQFYLERTGK